MRLKSVFLGVLVSLSIASPLRSLANWEGDVRDDKNTLKESQNKKENFISISESVLENAPYIPEELTRYKGKSKEYVKTVTAEEAVYGKVLDIMVTGYSSTPDQCWGNPFITASGERVKHGTMACPPQYAFGTQIEIEGMGTFVCEDRGGKIKGNHFDMWFASRGEALSWGVRTVEARIVNL